MRTRSNSRPRYVVYTAYESCGSVIIRLDSFYSFSYSIKDDRLKAIIASLFNDDTPNTNNKIHKTFLKMQNHLPGNISTHFKLFQAYNNECSALNGEITGLSVISRNVP